MDAKVVSAIHVNFSDEVIYNVIDEEKTINLAEIGEFVYSEEFDE
jgi:hypothetical protein